MASSQGVELADSILEDPTKAIPLLRLLHLFNTSRGDPLRAVEADEIMLHVYTRIEHCREAMVGFLSEGEDESNPIPKAA